MRNRRDFLKEAAVMTLASALPASSLAADPPGVANRLKARIPSTGEELLRVGLGTYKTFDVDDDASARKGLSSVLSAFVEGGGTLVDSSPMYGSAEEVVGDLSAQLRLNEKLFMATKVWISGKEAGIRQMNESFAKLKRQKLELMQIHNLLDWKLHLPVLRKWKEEGRIKYLGITHYTPSAFDEMEKVLQSEPMDFIQIPYSLGETAGEKRLIPYAAEKGVAVIANEPFAAGALFRPVKGKQVPGWAKEMGMATWAQYFLKFILSLRDVQFAIPATRRVEHCKDNLAAASGPLPSAEQREKMRREFASL
jgi:diketogulonate reductase-like aldo/keto reductase